MALTICPWFGWEIDRAQLFYKRRRKQKWLVCPCGFIYWKQVWRIEKKKKGGTGGKEFS